MARAKEHLNVIFIGHVDHGKSTTVGRLMFDAGFIDELTLRKLKEKAEQLGKSGFEFAYVMDELKEEQERGVTIDLAHKKFETKKYEYTIIDAPGHRDFIKNMITGASQADAGVLVVAAPETIGCSEEELVAPQTREHAFLSKTFGIKQLIVSINKMDMVGYDQKKFEMAKGRIEKLLKSIGYDTSKIPFVPAAAFKSDNVVKKSENMPWYTGKTLLENLDELTPPQKPTNLPLRLPLQDVYNITGIGAVPVGKIETGVIRPGDKIVAVPGREGKGVLGECKTVEMHHSQVPIAEPGDNIGFSVRGIGAKDVAKGDVVGPQDNWPTVAEEFTARIVVINHPSVITIGYTPVFHIHTAQVACQIVELIKTINPATGETVQTNPDFIKNGSVAEVRIKPTRPMCIEKTSAIPQLARFAIRDSGSTVAAGQCIDVKAKKMQ
jgi:elongation factor 1-alpha